MPAERKITLRFRARVAADGRNVYTVLARLSTGKGSCGSESAGTIARDIKAGQVITHELWVPFRCRGRFEIQVGYTQQREPSAAPFTFGATRRSAGRLYGSAEWVATPE